MSIKSTGIASVNDEDRRAHILRSAYSVFLRYGFKRSTMLDIARDTGLSRPALYLVFKNKEDIFRALAQSMCDQGIEEATKVLGEKLQKSDKLYKILDVSLFGILEELSGSPHGTELMGVENELAADIATYWHLKISNLLAHVIKGPQRTMLANLVLDAIQGMKKRGIASTEMRDTVKRFLKLI